MYAFLLFRRRSLVSLFYCNNMKKNAALNRVNKVCLAAAKDTGCELVDVAFEKEQTGLYLRVYIDTEQGVCLDDCERYHRLIQPQLEDVNYDFLEVSSPGVDRPIRSAYDVRKALGQEVEIKLYKPLNGMKIYLGTFEGLDSAGYHLRHRGMNMVFPARDVAVARRVVDLSEAIAMEAEELEVDNE